MNVDINMASNEKDAEKEVLDFQMKLDDALMSKDVSKPNQTKPKNMRFLWTYKRELVKDLEGFSEK